MSKISIIVAMSRNNVIGIDNAMPWKQREDLKFFKSKTLNKVVIMGRKTFESIGKPLPNRTNIVITTDSKFSTINNVKTFNSLDKALEYYKEEQEIIIAGGGQLYKQSINKADTLYITYIETKIEEGEIFFPKLPDNFKEVSEIKKYKDKNNQYDYSFIELERKF